MKKVIINISALFILLSFVGCDDFFATTVSLDPPETTPKLAISAIWNSTDLTVSAFVDGSTDIFSGNNSGFGSPKGIEGAKVELFTNGTLIGELLETLPTDPYATVGVYSLDLDDFLFTYGSEFELVVSHPDYPTTRATQKIPTKVEPTNYKYLANAGLDEYGYETAGVEITFQDPPGETNFYEVAVFFKDSTGTDQQVQYYFNSTYSTTFDPNASQGPNYSDLFVNGTGFDGEEYRLLVQFDSYGDTSEDLVVVFNSITEGRYLYATSLRGFMDAGDFGPFSEPVTIASNFENGLGTFGLGNVNIDEL